MRAVLPAVTFALPMILATYSSHSTAYEVQGAPALPTSTLFQSEDIFDLEYATHPQISPDGAKILYTRNSNDIMTDKRHSSMWLIDTKSGQQTPLFSDQFQYSQATWSPDGKRIAFVSNRTGSNQIHVHYIMQNRTMTVSRLEKSARNLSWSPDGDAIAFTMSVDDKPTKLAKMPKKPIGANWAPPVIVIDKARYQADGTGLLKLAYTHIFAIPSIGGTERQLTQGNFHHRGKLTWTVDSKAIVFSANRSVNWEYETLESDLYQVNLSDGELTQLTKQSGREYHPVFSPSGKKLAFLKTSAENNPYRNAKLHVMNWQSKSTQAIAADFDRSIVDPQWITNKALAIQYDDFGKRKVAKLSLKGKITDLTDGVSGTSTGRPYISGNYSIDKHGSVAFTHGSANRPADISLINQKGQLKKLTHLNEDLLGHKTLGEVHEVTYSSSFDQEKIQGWYITPPNFDPNKKYPLILEIHGGPHLAYGPHFSAELQRFAAQGYVVFYDNHRGSSSYGERFAMLLKYKYSSKEDYADHDSGVNAMIDMGFIDKDNLFIAGGSAGGIASAYAIGLTDRYAAAAVAKPVINWISKVLTADSYLGQTATQFPGLPWEHVEHYWQRSPLSLVGNVTTPTLLITGESDRRTPISETEQFYQALKLRKVDTVMVRVPGSPHGIAGRPSRMIAKIENILAWFEKYKK